eukprot:80025_1
MASSLLRCGCGSVMIFTILMSFVYVIILHSTTTTISKIRYIHDNHTEVESDTPHISESITDPLSNVALNLSFLDASYYKSKVFGHDAPNKFINIFKDFLSMPGNPRNHYTPTYIFFDMEYNNPRLIYCAGISLAGIGNHLAQYWTARAVGFWLGYDFQMMDNAKDQRCWEGGAIDMHDKYFSNTTWSYYLPKHSHDSVYSHYATDNAARHRIFLWITQTLVALAKRDGWIKYCYKGMIRLFWYNELYVRTVIRDTHRALDQYFASTDTSVPVIGANDAVIHFRCGDILQAGGNEYGFMTIAYYKQAFMNWKWTEDTTVHLLTQLGNNSLRTDDLLGLNLERRNQDKCTQIATEYVVELQKLVMPAQIVIHGNDLMDDDFYMMVHAPLLICSESTFCGQAALANTNHVVMPIYGPWLALEEMIDGGIWTPTNHRFIRNSLTQFTLSSSKLNKNNMNTTQVVQYLVTH